MRHGYVHYWRFPGGELQYGRRSGKIMLWFRGRAYRLRRPRPHDQWKPLDGS